MNARRYDQGVNGGGGASFSVSALKISCLGSLLANHWHSILSSSFASTTVILGPPDFNLTTSPTLKAAMENPFLSHRGLKSNRLQLVAAGEEFHDDREPPLSLGNVARLNSGGPAGLVVGFPERNTLTLAWRDSAGNSHEANLPRPCVHRIEVAD
jgi:hypothetical protein